LGVINCIILIWALFLYLSTLDGTFMGSDLFWFLFFCGVNALKWVLAPLLILRALWFIFVLSWICISKVDTGLDRLADRLIDPLIPEGEARNG
jgi:hypothetical protein